jgi:hypothetical protein
MMRNCDREIVPIEPVEHRGWVIGQGTERIEKGGIVSHEYLKTLHISRKPRARIWNADRTAFLTTMIHGRDSFRSVASAKAAIDFAEDHPSWVPVSRRELKKAERLGLTPAKGQ